MSSGLDKRGRLLEIKIDLSEKMGPYLFDNMSTFKRGSEKQQNSHSNSNSKSEFFSKNWFDFSHAFLD